MSQVADSVISLAMSEAEVSSRVVATRAKACGECRALAQDGECCLMLGCLLRAKKRKNFILMLGAERSWCPQAKWG